MYTHKNYTSKKALKEDLKAGAKITIYNPGPFADAPKNGTTFLEGPHYPMPHRWYAEVTMKDGYIESVK